MKASLQNLSHKNLPTILTTAAFLALYVAGVWYVGHLEASVRATATELASEATRESSMRSLSGFLEELSAEETRLSSYFAGPEEAVATIEAVERLGDIAGAPVVVGGVEIKDQDPETGEGKMVMTVAAEGSWRAVTKLLALLDTFPKASGVDTVTLVAGSSEGKRVWSLRAMVYVTLHQ